MRKAVNLLPALFVALTSVAFAQTVDKKAENTETVKVTVSGMIDLDYIYADSSISEVRNSSQVAAGLDDDGTTRIAHAIQVRLDVELTDKVSAVVELITFPIGDALGTNSVTPNGTLSFRNVYIQLAEVFDPAITLRAGQVYTNFDIRGKGSSIVLDTVYAEDVDFDINNNAGSTDGNLSSAVASRGSAGVVIDYKRDNIAFQLGLLPETRQQNAAVAIEDPSDDDSTYYASLFYNLDSMGKGSRIGLLAAIFHGDGSSRNNGIITVGGGVDLFGLVDNMEVYGEVYLQFGGAGLDGAGDELDAGGMAFQAGLEYMFEGEQKPWVHVKVTFLSGDDDGTDTDVENWVSMENQGDLMILEHHVFGLDIDSNYFAIKVGGGISFSTGGPIQNNVQLSAWLGIARLNEDIDFGTGSEDGLGNELDVNLNWVYSKAVNVTAGVAFLFGSDVLEAVTTEEEDSAMLYTVGVNAKW